VITERVLVLGAGTMGAGIAQVCAQTGRRVLLADVAEAGLIRAQAGMARSLAKLEAKGRIQEEAGVVAARVETAVLTDGQPLPDWGADVVVEAVFEDVDLKRRVLATAEAACREGALLASNTSGIPITTLGEALRAPERFVGLHFFNPAVLMRVVEVVAGDRTAVLALDEAEAFVRSLGKEPLRVRRDVPGFVLNRIAMVASNEAIRLVQDEVATAREVDAGVKGAFGWRMGPLETADLVGLDVVLAARTQIWELSGDARFEPPELLRGLVAQGRLGRKSGRGFYDHEEED